MKSLRLNGAKSVVIVLGGEDLTVCDTEIQGERMEQGHRSKCPGCVVKDWGTMGVMNVIVMNGKRIALEIKALVNEKELSLECASALHKSLLISTRMDGSETMVWEESEKARIRAAQMDNLRAMFGARKSDGMRNAKHVIEINKTYQQIKFR